MIQCENLRKCYGKTQALAGLNLHIEEGALHGFVGPNGAGKTTAMRIFSTLLKPTDGRVLVCGADAEREPQRVRRLVGYMPDFFGVYDNLKVWEYLDFYAACVNMSEKDRRKQIDSLLEMTVLSDKREAYVDHLSRGMKQRLCLARALMHDPKILILDEPASGMDPQSRSEMCDILRDIHAMGKTVLISSHILPELSKLCDSFTILRHGQTAFCGKAAELQSRLDSKDVLEIRFSQPPDESAKEWLAARADSAPKAQMDTVWRIECSQTPKEDAALLSALIDRGTQVCGFGRQSVTLEDAFMEVMSND